MAHKKAGGSSRNGRDTEGKRLGVKKFGGERVTTGSIIVAQRGTAMKPGRNVAANRTHFLFALADGAVKFDRRHDGRLYVSVDPVPTPAAAAPAASAPPAAE